MLLTNKHIKIPLVLTIIFAGGCIWAYSFDSFVFWVFLWTFAVPVSVALWITVVIYRITSYKEQVAERILKRNRLRTAGVAIIISSSNTILMNRQEKQEPWRDEFIPPGGYFREGKDGSTGVTARRRYTEITDGYRSDNNGISLGQGIHIAELDTSSLLYLDYIASRNYAVVDVDAYFFENRDGERIKECDIESHEDLQWFDKTDLKNRNDIVDYYKELSLAIIEGDMSKIRFWDLTEDGRRFLNTQ